MSRFVCLAVFVLVLLAALVPSGIAGTLAKKTMIYLYDGESDHVKKVSRMLRDEMTALAKGRYEITFLADQHAEWQPQKAQVLLAQAMNNPQIDLIVVSGVNLTFAVLNRIPLPKPVVVADFIDPSFLGLPRTAEDSSGLPNLTYIAKTKGAAADFAVFRRMLRFQTLHVLIDDAHRRFADEALKKMGPMDFQVKLVPARGDVSAIVSAIGEEKIEALYLLPLRLTQGDYLKLVEAINQRKIPTFSAFGFDDVEKGVLAGRLPKVFNKFTRRIAMNADRILLGEEAAHIPVTFELEDKLFINQCTAEKIALSLPFDVLMDAEVLCQGETGGEDLLTLDQAVDESLTNNLNFRVIEEQIKIARKDYLLAWTNYLPALHFNMDYDINDSERANHVARTPKWNYGYGFSLNQLIFSHPVFFDIANTKKQIKVEEYRRQSEELDITHDTIIAYFGYLSAKALHKVSLEYLKAIEVNLDIAEKRRQTGAGGREEILRWQSERAEKKSDIVKREATIYQTRVILNQLMNRRQEQLFLEQDVGLETVEFYIGSQALHPYVEDHKKLMAFLEFATEQAMADSPEIRALEIGIEQQKNVVRSADGKFILPEMGLSSETSHVFKDKYYQPITGQRDDWEVKLRMSYPLFDQGRRPIESFKQRNELHRLEFVRDLRKQEIERNLRRAAYNIYSSLPAIRLRAEAMSSASENYEIVEKKYTEGVSNITELIDAQINKYNRQALAVVAIYDFFVNLADFDRHMAAYYMLASEAERQLWLKKVQEYFQNKGIVP